jgi:CRP-like cAMP-binding protein
VVEFPESMFPALARFLLLKKESSGYRVVSIVMCNFKLMKSLQEFILSTGASPELMSHFTSGIKQKTIKKGTILQASGDEAYLSFFVRKGLLRSYTIDEKGKEARFK